MPLQLPKYVSIWSRLLSIVAYITMHWLSNIDVLVRKGYGMTIITRRGRYRAHWTTWTVQFDASINVVWRFGLDSASVDVWWHWQDHGIDVTRYKGNLSIGPQIRLSRWGNLFWRWTKFWYGSFGWCVPCGCFGTCPMTSVRMWFVSWVSGRGARGSTGAAFIIEP